MGNVVRVRVVWGVGGREVVEGYVVGWRSDAVCRVEGVGGR